MPLNLSGGLIARWEDSDPRHIPLLQAAGIAALVAPASSSAFRASCGQAGIRVLGSLDLTVGGLSQLGGSGDFALEHGIWPGIRKVTPRKDEDETASASREPWVDSNGYWIACLRALYPQREALLAVKPPAPAPGVKRSIPFDTLELALIEARTQGGDSVLALESRYREKLLAGDEKALAAWKSLGRTARWMWEHRALFGQPAFPAITALVDRGPQSAEICNLLYRRIASPAVVSALDLPTPDAQQRFALVAANLAVPDEELRRRILLHARAGTTVVVAAPPAQAWWTNPELKLERKDPDRDIYTLGGGRLVAYRNRILDPSEFALDVIDLITHKRRRLRLWNAPSVIATATPGPLAGPLTSRAVLTAINYGAPIDSDVQARVYGWYSSARLLRPEAAPLELKTARRGPTTEVMIPELQRLGVVVFG